MGRAWCVAEIAEADQMKMAQRMKVLSAQSLDNHQEALKHLRIQDMHASRPEDIKEILSKIPDHESFNERLHNLIFDSLIAQWNCLDPTEQLELVGRLARWQIAQNPN